MYPVKPKKSLGQHFLKDENIARKIAESLNYRAHVLEIGPGTGVLTKYLMLTCDDFKACEIDQESVAFLHETYIQLDSKIIHGDFLKMKFENLFDAPFSVIGNFPYNISSQIFFRIIEHRNLIPEVVCMLQKEVALRMAAPPGSKTYGILSVLIGAYYDIKYLFTVNEQVFIPPPKVKSAVIRLERKESFVPDFDEEFFFRIVKAGFNQRRKTLRNSLRELWTNKINPDDFPVFSKRPEQLSVHEFFDLTRILS